MPRYAVNICDLSELTKGPGADLVVQIMLQDFIAGNMPHEIVNLDRQHNIDEGAAVLNGPAAKDEKRIKAFIELLQTHVGPKKIGRRIRCYEEGPKGGWKEINVGKPKGGDRVPLQA